MTYIPNPDDATQPTDGEDASTAAAEFRALKAKVNNLVIASGAKLPKRQTVITGPVTSGLPTHLAVSATTLGVDIKAGVTYGFASGFTSAGSVDLIQAVSTDITNAFGALPLFSTSFLAVDYAQNANPTALKTLVAPQYSRMYDQTQCQLLMFTGAALSTTFLDSFGNTWTAQSTARIQNNNFKFGTGALGGSGSGNALNGTSDYIKATSLNKIYPEGWTLRGWVFMPSLPTAGNRYAIGSFLNAANFGIDFYCYNNAGTIRFGFDLSSNGSSNNVASNIVGTSTPNASTWYYVELTFDKQAGIYRLYVGGTQEQTVASALPICPTTQAAIGARANGTNFFAGYIDKVEFLPYCDHPNGTAYTVPAASPDITAQGYSPDFFSLVDYKMYQITGASMAAGADPSMTAKTRLYVGEADTNGLIVTAVRPYAYNGLYMGTLAYGQPAAATVINNNHNIGTKLINRKLELTNLLAELGYSVGDTVDNALMNAGGTLVPVMPWVSRNNVGFTMGSSAAVMSVVNRATGGISATTQANWGYRLIAERSF